MDKLMDSDLDPSTYTCVNPHDVNPLLGNPVLTSRAILADIPLKRDMSSGQQDTHLSDGAEFLRMNKKIKLEMEEFSDLSSFLPKTVSLNSVDELNTPIFDKDAFDFDIFTTGKDTQPEELIKLECDAYCENIIPGCKLTNIQYNADKMDRIKGNSGNINELPDNNSIIIPKSKIDGAYTCRVLPSNDNSVYDVDATCAQSVNSSNRQYTVSSEEQQHAYSGAVTPDDSNSSAIYLTLPKFKLNVNMKTLYDESNLSTPIIIDEVVDLESSGFNILDLVNNEDINLINAEEIFSSTSPSSTGTSPPQRKRSWKYEDCDIDDDNDEDYIPPCKKARKRKISYSDSDQEEDVKPFKTRTRGRPPKRTGSVSSDCSKDSDVSKYRQLRDKNNEASRKSRLKRKKKELELEKEADELNFRNIKLKAQVEELEKMVNNFRENIFKIMTKK